MNSLLHYATVTYGAQAGIGALCLWLAWCLWRDDDRPNLAGDDE